MEEGLLSLKWNNHKSTFTHVLSSLREKEAYTDATLACEEMFFPVHKLVLSTCSDYFGEVFRRTSCKAPVIILKGIKCKELVCLLDYMYRGEVDVRQNELADLIKAAEYLEIKGLSVPDEDPTLTDSKNSITNRDLSPPRKKQKVNSTKTLNNEDNSLNQTLNNSNVQNTYSNISSSLIPVETIKLEEPEETDIKSNFSLNKSSMFTSNKQDVPDDNDSVNTERIDKEEHDIPMAGPSGLQEDSLPWADTDDAFPIHDNDSSQQHVCITTMDPELTASRMFHGSVNVNFVQPRGQEKRKTLNSTLNKMDGIHQTGSYESNELIIMNPSDLDKNFVIPSDGSHTYSKSQTGSSIFKVEYYPSYTVETEPKVTTQPVKSEDQQHVKNRLVFRNCQMCSYRTKSIVDLNKHVRVHTREKPYKCPSCTYSTGDKSNLNRHVTRVHKVNQKNPVALVDSSQTLPNIVSYIGEPQSDVNNRPSE